MAPSETVMIVEYDISICCKKQERSETHETAEPLTTYPFQTGFSSGNQKKKVGI